MACQCRISAYFWLDIFTALLMLIKPKWSITLILRLCGLSLVNDRSTLQALKRSVLLRLCVLALSLVRPYRSRQSMVAVLLDLYQMRLLLVQKLLRILGSCLIILGAVSTGQPRLLCDAGLKRFLPNTSFPTRRKAENLTSAR